MEHPFYSPVAGADLKARREAAGVTLDAMAPKAKRSRQALARWEKDPELPYLKARKYLDALTAVVADETQASVA